MVMPKASRLVLEMRNLPEPAHLPVQNCGECLSIGMGVDRAPKTDSCDGFFPTDQGAHAIHQIAVPKVRYVIGAYSIFGFVSNMGGAHG